MPRPAQRGGEISDDIIAAFRRACELWHAAHTDDNGPQRGKWLTISKRLNWTLLGLPPHCCPVENPALDGEPFTGDGYGMTRDWERCQDIRRALIKAARNGAVRSIQTSRP